MADDVLRRRAIYWDAWPIPGRDGPATLGDTARNLAVTVTQGRFVTVGHSPSGDGINMQLRIVAIVMAGSALLMAGSHHAHAQASARFQSALGKAELAELSPQMRADVEARMRQVSQTVPEILQTILLNSIKLKYPANRIVALDFGRGVAIVQLPTNEMRAIEFNTRTLEITS
jgi:hypothetical protein